jgi:3-phenylpropionate/cinnamic acid dioxygenase small subunit
MSELDRTGIAAALLYREGLMLDRQEWDAWLDLYATDAEYWVPAWKSESQLVDNVRREISLIYHPSRAGLDERVLRIRSRKSVTAMPIPRTVHLVANVRVEEGADDLIEGTASWVVHEYDPRVSKAHTNFGRCEFRLRRVDRGWKIARKKVILVNDLIPTVIDFFNL